MGSFFSSFFFTVRPSLPKACWKRRASAAKVTPCARPLPSSSTGTAALEGSLRHPALPLISVVVAGGRVQLPHPGLPLWPDRRANGPELSANPRNGQHQRLPSRVCCFFFIRLLWRRACGRQAPTRAAAAAKPKCSSSITTSRSWRTKSSCATRPPATSSAVRPALFSVFVPHHGCVTPSLGAEQRADFRGLLARRAFAKLMATLLVQRADVCACVLV